MKQIKLLTLLMGIVLFGCGKGNQPTPEPESITLSADKTDFVADGKDIVTLKVVLQDGKDVTAKSSFLVNGKEQKENTFFTKEPGTYRVIAKYEKLTSSEVLLTASEEPIKEIRLTTDKTTIVADGKETATFKVVLKDGTDVTVKSAFTINGKEQKENTFFTKEPGTYKVVAKYEKSVSSEVVIKATKDAVLTISCAKNALLNDGYDFAILSVKDEDFIDRTSSAKFFSNGVAIEGNIFKNNVNGDYKITAKVNDKDVSGTLTIKVSDNVKFLDRVLAENFTATWCGYCPPVKEKLKTEAMANSQIIVVSLQSNDELTGDSAPVVQKLANYFKITGIPAVVINRSVKWNTYSDIASYIEPESFIGIAIETKTSGKSISVKPILRSKQPFSGKILIGITEDGISAYQNGAGNMEHSYILRNYYPNEWGKEISLEKDKTTVMAEQTFTLPDKCNISNCNVLVIMISSENKVITAQQVKAGNTAAY